ncbi:MAG: two-component sensor histidine kinase [Candidatus Latescibacterota bacterium]|jgi:two-component sensor histidine kinase
MNLERPATLGLRLVKTLVSQLGGKIELNKHNGTHFELRFHNRKKH